MLAFLKGLEDRINNGEKLVAGSFVFGIQERRTERPLKGSFSNDMFSQVSVCLFGEKESKCLRTHSARKGGTSSLMAVEGTNTDDVRLLGR